MSNTEIGIIISTRKASDHGQVIFGVHQVLFKGFEAIVLLVLRRDSTTISWLSRRESGNGGDGKKSKEELHLDDLGKIERMEA